MKSPKVSKVTFLYGLLLGLSLPLFTLLWLYLIDKNAFTHLLTNTCERASKRSRNAYFHASEMWYFCMAYCNSLCYYCEVLRGFHTRHTRLDAGVLVAVEFIPKQTASIIIRTKQYNSECMYKWSYPQNAMECQMANTRVQWLYNSPMTIL